MAKHNPKAFHKFIVSTADQLGFFLFQILILSMLLSLAFDEFRTN